MNIVLLANELNYTSGVTNHLIHLSRGLSAVKGSKLWIICGGGNGTDRFDNINVKVVINKNFLHEERNMLSYTSAITFLVNFIIRNKIDIMHSHTHYAANIAKSASKLTAACTVQTNHGLLEDKGTLKHFNAKKYIAVNQHILDHIINRRIADSADVKLIRCGIPVPEIMPVKNKSRIKVIAAARFIREKGLDTYIRAVSLLNKETKSLADFFIAGDGELKQELLDINKETGAGISYLGNVKDMDRLLSSFHILVYPSRSQDEGFPAIITEAAANGLLVITSNFNGVDTVLTNNKDGIIFPVDDTAGLAKKLDEAINKYGSYSDTVNNFYNKVHQWYSLDTMITKHMELYTECLQ